MGALASQITSLAIVYSTRLFRRRSKKTSKLRVTGLCAGNSPVTGEFTAEMASNAENVSIWWRHHVTEKIKPVKLICKLSACISDMLVSHHWVVWSRLRKMLRFSYSRQYGESLTRHSSFEPISARRGLGKPASRLTSLGELNRLCSLPE